MKQMLVFAALLFVAAAEAFGAEPDVSPSARILASRSSIVLQDGTLTGPGSAGLLRAAGNANDVSLGEDHGTREIAQFSAALFAALVPHGFHTVVVETSPTIASKLERWIASPDGRAQYSAFEERFNGTVPFYGWKDEYAFLERASRATSGRLDVWGLDQELMGASTFLLESIGATHPPAPVQAQLQALIARDASDMKNAYTSGDPMQTFMMLTPREPLVALRDELRASGDRDGARYAGALLDSRDIYVDCCNAHAYQSNRMRSQLMKRTLLSYLANQPTGKLFFKFGEEHLYRGFNVIRNNDLGNFVAERADAAGTSDIRILALGAAGEQIKFAGMGRWTHAKYGLLDDAHARFAYLKPFVEAMYPTGWTLFDLRPFRSHFAAMGIPDKDYERLVYGYDFLLLIPKTTADDPLDPKAF